MASTPKSAPIPIGGGKRGERNNSDGNPPEDMSFLSYPPTPFDILSGEMSGNERFSIDSLKSALNDTRHSYAFGTSPIMESSTTSITEPSAATSESTTNCTTTPHSTPAKKLLNLEKEFELLPGEIRIRVVTDDAKNHDPTKPEKEEKDQNIYICNVEGGSIMLTNYRVIFLSDTHPQVVSVYTLMELELIDLREQNQVIISMKGGRVQRFLFSSSSDSMHWHQKLIEIVTMFNRGQSVITTGGTLKTTNSDGSIDPIHLDVFAWEFSKAVDQSDDLKWLKSEGSYTPEIVQVDFKRLGMEEQFKITTINEDFKVCPSYPRKIIIPKSMDEEAIKKAAYFRSSNRFPACVWRCRKTNSILLRSSQPQIGFSGFGRSFEDEKLIEEVVKCSQKEGEEPKTFVILDCRSTVAAMANRLKGGGSEYSDYYQRASVEFLGLPNIHTIFSSFSAMRNLLNGNTNNDQLLTSLQTTGWLQNMSNLLVSASRCADYLSKGHSVLVHCSDGWDRTAQVVSLAKLMLDDYYRTVNGFEELIRREWLDFGHKFYDRQQSIYGLSNWNCTERSPIFLQFLEAVRHLQREQAYAFEFTHAYLIKLAQHAHSGLFGTFLFNCQRERVEALEEKKASLVEIWRFLGTHNAEFVNQSFDSDYRGPLKTMNFSVLHLRAWHEVFSDDEEKYNNLYKNTNALTPSGSSPPKEICERPSSGCGSTMSMSQSTTLIKSKSSESINSINVDQSHHVSVGNVDPLASSASSSLGPINSSFTETSTSLMNQSSHQQHQHWPSRKVIAVQDMLDFDGLLKYQDDEQEVQRRNNMKHYMELQELRKKQTLSNSPSNTPNGVNGTKNRENSMSEALDDESLDGGRAGSDLSIVNYMMDMPTYAARYWDANQMGKCYCCEKDVKKMSFSADDAEHHCRNCGNIVCSSCSTNTFHVFEDGASKQKRACDKCYQLMQNTSGLDRTTSLTDVQLTTLLSNTPSSCSINCPLVPNSSPSSLSLNMLPSSSSSPPLHFSLSRSSCKSPSTQAVKG